MKYVFILFSQYGHHVIKRINKYFSSRDIKQNHHFSPMNKNKSDLALQTEQNKNCFPSSGGENIIYSCSWYGLTLANFNSAWVIITLQETCEIYRIKIQTSMHNQHLLHFYSHLWYSQSHFTKGYWFETWGSLRYELFLKLY